MAEINAQSLNIPPQGIPSQSSQVQPAASSNRQKKIAEKKEKLAAQLRENPLGTKEEQNVVQDKKAENAATSVPESTIEVQPENPVINVGTKVEDSATKPPEPSPLDRLMAEAQKLAEKRKPVAISPPKVETKTEEVVQEDRTEPEIKSQETKAQKAQRTRLLNSLVEELGSDPDEVFRRLAAEYEALINGKEIPDYQPPTNPALVQVESVKSELEAIRAENQKLQEMVNQKFSGMEQERQTLFEQARRQNARTFLSKSATKYPYLARSNQELMANQLVELVDLAAQYPETSGLTLDDLADKLEATRRSEIDKYKDLFVNSTSKSSEAPKKSSEVSKSSDIENKVAQTPGTLAPGQLNAGSSKQSNRRLTEAERKERALAVWKSGNSA